MSVPRSPACGRQRVARGALCSLVVLLMVGPTGHARAQATPWREAPVPAEPLRSAPVTGPTRLDPRPAQQDASPRRAAADANFVHFELLGNAGLYSLNYSRLLYDDFSARIGISYVALGASISRTSARADALTIPLIAHYLGVGRGAHKLELGLGPLFVYGSARARLEAREAIRARFRVLASATIGYRYLARGGFTFNVGFTPVFGPIFLPWGGMGVGHTF
jgi:hypothetical protein